MALGVGGELMQLPLISEKAARFTESVIRGMSIEALKYDAVNLAQGMPDFPAPQVLKDAACLAIQDDINQYAITWGARNLRHAIAEHAAWHLGLTVDPETELTVTCGSTEAMLVVLLSLINPGDEVILSQPFYENYWPDCVLAGAAHGSCRCVRRIGNSTPTNWLWRSTTGPRPSYFATPTTPPARSSHARTWRRSRPSAASGMSSLSPTRSTSTSSTTAGRTLPSPLWMGCTSGPSRSAGCPRPTP